MNHKRFLLLLSLCFFTSVAFAQSTPKIASVEEPVKRQLEGYNKRDIGLFVSAYSDTVRVYRQPGQLAYQGRDEMRKRYGQMFVNTPDLHCKLVNRIISGNVVIDHEQVTRQKGQPPFEAIVVYRIRDGLIVEVTFISPDKE